MDLPQNELLNALKATSNKHNALNQQFQIKIRNVMNEIRSVQSHKGEGKIINEIDNLCADYSLANNRVELEFLIKSEHFLEQNCKNNDMKRIFSPVRVKREIFQTKIQMPQESQASVHNELNSVMESMEDSDLDSIENIKQETTKIYEFTDNEPQEEPHEDGFYHCDGCDKKWEQYKELESCKLLHLLKPFRCDWCSAAFAKAIWRDRHVQNMHIVKPFKCSHCDETFFSKTEKRKHQKTACAAIKIKRRKSKIKKPTDNGYNKEEYQNYVKVVGYPNTIAHQAIVSKCLVCNQVFPTKYKMRDHVFSEHPTEKPYSCDFCGSAFNVDRYLAAHLRNTHHIDPYKCDGCDAAFPFKQGLYAHKKECRGSKAKRVNEVVVEEKEISKSESEMEEDTQRWQCHYDKCVRSFNVKDSLIRHIRDDHNGYPFRCENCHEKYQYKQELIAHVAGKHAIVFKSASATTEPSTTLEMQNQDGPSDIESDSELEVSEDEVTESEIIEGNVVPPGSLVPSLKRKSETKDAEEEGKGEAKEGGEGILSNSVQPKVPEPPALKRQRSVHFDVANLIWTKQRSL